MNRRGTLDGMTLAGDRYLRLVEDLALEDRAENPTKPADKKDARFAYGWQIRVCSELKIDQSMVSKLWSGQQAPTIDLIEAAQDKQRIRYEYFHEKKLTSPHFRAYQRGRKVPAMGYRSFHEFLELSPKWGITLTEQEIATLSHQEWDGEPTPQTYNLLLQALRTMAPAETRVREKPVGKTA